ncbi:UNKNOWN [Stylonychia lemnae]|uniref:Uncharacterized protein n=1 Tax=Stylonychia lemnae TaxID=5949 RepID=A0A078AD38_STYLE|nr:UNKNOWN [Stylonychia lemnae]|eukprot:CDW79447.1 UNKNOWN [Stylonychia lemnae]
MSLILTSLHLQRELNITEAIFESQAQCLLLGASREAAYDGKAVTNSWLYFISPDTLKYIRIVLFTVLFSFGGYGLYAAGLARMLFWMSNWQTFTAIAAELLLLLSHFSTQNNVYDNIVKAIFEVAFPYSIMVTFLYWFVWYEPGWINLEDWKTLVGPLFLHVVPVGVLLIDWLINDIVFDYKRGALRMLWVCLSYIGLNYFAGDIIGRFPYSMINYQSWSTAPWLIGVTLLSMTIFYGVAFLTNFMKTGQGVSPSNYLKQIPFEFVSSFQILADFI